MTAVVTPDDMGREARTPFVDEFASPGPAEPHVIPIQLEAEPEQPVAPELESFAPQLESCADEPHAATASYAESLLAGESPRGRGPARPYEFYVTFERPPDRQGRVDVLRGESKEHANKLVGIGFAYQLTSPRDPATGAHTGKRQHGPVRLTKTWGAASPQLFDALVRNEVFAKVRFEFLRTSPGGGDVPFETITLRNASVAEVKRYSTSDRRELEEIALTFQQIEIANHPGKTRALDAWRANDGEIAFEDGDAAAAGSAYQGEPTEGELDQASGASGPLHPEATAGGPPLAEH